MMRQILLSFVIVVVGCFSLGSSNPFYCYRCSGNQKECAKAETVTCSAGQDRCLNMTVEKDGRKEFTFGCADEDDCNKQKMSCDASKFTNSRTKCPSACCEEPLCNKPPPEFKKDKNLTCYTCESGMSMDDCELNSKDTKCPGKEDRYRCAKITTEMMVGEMKVKSYRKRCHTSDVCTQKTSKTSDVFLQACNQGDKCDIHCCEGDLCNAGTFSSASVLAILACAIISVFFL